VNGILASRWRQLISLLEDGFERRFHTSTAWELLVRSAWVAFVFMVVTVTFAICVVETGWQMLPLWRDRLMQKALMTLAWLLIAMVATWYAVTDTVRWSWRQLGRYPFGFLLPVWGWLGLLAWIWLGLFAVLSIGGTLAWIG
jgi:hypothetical protein